MPHEDWISYFGGSWTPQLYVDRQRGEQSRWGLEIMHPQLGTNVGTWRRALLELEPISGQPFRSCTWSLEARDPELVNPF